MKYKTEISGCNTHDFIDDPFVGVEIECKAGVAVSCSSFGELNVDTVVDF